MPSISYERLARRYAFAPTFLRVAGTAGAGLSVLTALMHAVQIVRSNSPTGWVGWTSPLAWLIVGVTAWGGLSGLAALVDIFLAVVHESQRAADRATLEQTVQPPSQPATGDRSVPMAPSDGKAARTGAAGPNRDLGIQEMLDVLRELRDNSLLSDGQRAEKRVRIAEEEVGRTRRDVHDLLAGGHFVRARRIVEELQRRFPDRHETAEIMTEIEQARANAESQDVTAYSKRVEELMSISAWDRAAQTARELQDRHPQNEAAQQLVARVTRERELFVTEQQRRMYAEIQRYVSRRRWREALAASKTYIESFPGLPEAETLRAQIPTIQANAEVEERQELESQITDLAKHGRYVDAFNLARHLVEKFPESPQADVLRPQLPRLKELAHDPRAAPARVRIET